ncbi:MAG TPA: alpha/beta hydrolase [Aggregatilineales bacterium]|nr:alpha/beta hydrolase [Aggregatilineales bacterium]
MPFIELSTGAGIDYMDSGGDKPVMTLLHGFLGTGETQFPNVVEWLMPNYRIIAPTMRGYGASTPKPRTFPHNFYEKDARDMLALLEALHIQKTHLMGFSDGGEVSLLMSGYSPETFLSVGVWGAVGYYGSAMRPHAQRMFPATWMTDDMKALHGIAHADAFVLGWVKTIHAIIDSGGDVSRGLAHNMSAPLLMMLGDKDYLNPPEYAQEIIGRAHNARLEMFACGHAIHNEAWADFQRVVGEFLASIA